MAGGTLLLTGMVAAPAAALAAAGFYVLRQRRNKKEEELHPWPGGAKRRSALRLRGDGQSGLFWFSMCSLMMARGAPPQDAAKWDGDQKCAPHRYLRMCPANSRRSR